MRPSGLEALLVGKKWAIIRMDLNKFQHGAYKVKGAHTFRLEGVQGIFDTLESCTRIPSDYTWRTIGHDSYAVISINDYTEIFGYQSNEFGPVSP